ncbi:MAG: hypothetical protein RBR35_17685 [Salinivirgaceae bacterium]|nr:hypothetical protein [Salinivirgaceae bacterium]
MARPNKYAKMSQEEFDSLLNDCIKDNAANLLSIPGAYEVFSEHFNNEVLDRWTDDQGLPVDEEYGAIWDAIEALDRNQLVEVLEGFADIQCYDNEGIEVLQQATYQCVLDGDFDIEDLLKELSCRF